MAPHPKDCKCNTCKVKRVKRIRETEDVTIEDGPSTSRGKKSPLNLTVTKPDPHLDIDSIDDPSDDDNEDPFNMTAIVIHPWKPYRIVFNPKDHKDLKEGYILHDKLSKKWHKCVWYMNSFVLKYGTEKVLAHIYDMELLLRCERAFYAKKKIKWKQVDSPQEAIFRSYNIGFDLYYSMKSSERKKLKLNEEKVHSQQIEGECPWQSYHAVKNMPDYCCNPEAVEDEKKLKDVNLKMKPMLVFKCRSPYCRQWPDCNLVFHSREAVGIHVVFDNPTRFGIGCLDAGCSVVNDDPFQFSCPHQPYITVGQINRFVAKWTPQASSAFPALL